MAALRKTYASAEELEKDLEGSLASGGIMLETANPPSAREKMKVELALGRKVVVELEAEVVYTAPSGSLHAVGLELKADWRARLEAVREQAKEAGEGEPDQRWGKDSESLYHSIAKLTTSEKIQLALKGGRQERRVLLKDTHYMVHPYVLKNPRISTEEVTQISRMMSITVDMIDTIASNTEWMANNAVRLAIIKHPKAPAHLVQKHIGKLNDSDLMMLAKSEHVKDTVSKMATRILASHGKAVR